MVGWRARRTLTPYTYLIPTIALLAVFMFYPIGNLFWLGLFKWDLMTPRQFVGFQNLHNVLLNPDFWTALKLTCIFAVVSIPINVTLAFSTALLVNQELRLKNLYRAIVFYPSITSVVAVGWLWRYMYSTEYGVLNYFLKVAGLAKIGWISNPQIALYSLTATGIWYGFGWNVIIFLAGLQSISAEYYEAARMDGAGFWKMTWHITLPFVRGITELIVVMALIYAFRWFNLFWTMSEGGPGNSTRVLMLYLYRSAFQMGQFGEGAAISIYMFAVVLVLTLVTLRLFRPKSPS